MTPTLVNKYQTNKKTNLPWKNTLAYFETKERELFIIDSSTPVTYGYTPSYSRNSTLIDDKDLMSLHSTRLQERQGSSRSGSGSTPRWPRLQP